MTGDEPLCPKWETKTGLGSSPTFQSHSRTGDNRNSFACKDSNPDRLTMVNITGGDNYPTPPPYVTKIRKAPGRDFPGITGDNRITSHRTTRGLSLITRIG